MSSLTRSGSQLRKLGSMAGRDRAAAPGWGALARQHAGQYAALVALLVVLALSERWDPFHRSFYVGHTSDLDTWRYSYPLKANTVPAWAMPCVAVFTPLLLLAGMLAAGRISRTEAHHAALLALYCVATTGLLTNWIKCEVGRPRPHFRNRCWPGGAQPVFSPDGLPKCADAAVDPAEGIKSFPSGHTAWSTSGLAYTSLWLLGKLRVFGGQQAQPARFLLALSPLLGALWIGMSRMQDYWHHWEDVTCGFLLGLLMAWAHYRQVYPSVLSDQAGVLMAAVRGGSSNGRLAVPASRLQLLYQGSQGELKGLEEAAAADDKV